MSNLPLNLVPPLAVAPSFTAPYLTQFFRHCNFSNVSVVIESLCDVTVNLARLNDLSQSVATAGIASISRANWLAIGNCPCRRYRSRSLPITVVFAVLLLTRCLNIPSTGVLCGTLADAVVSTIVPRCSSTGRLQRY
ncbi:hypothetical protein FOZG_18188 [Fusarium oxysporum Fo47]|uniref:Uncharacterized protein n=1 Tax=Fusarium oxysporum Fo47 TaxID=660027 RepID=W9J8C2_FUSOX|nr:hypothetical protein FOZG_18188 [Fusarium oxysporum Fo47]